MLITSNGAALGLLQSMDLGVPFLGVVSQGNDLHRVSLDQYAGAKRAVRHLIELGHTKIRHVSGPIESMDALERARGWRDLLAENDLVAHDRSSVTGRRPAGTRPDDGCSRTTSPRSSAATTRWHSA